MKQLASAAELTLSCDVEYECTSKGYPETGPTYSCGGTPAEPPEFNIKVFLNGTDITTLLSQSQFDEIEQMVADEYSAEEPDCGDPMPE